MKILDRYIFFKFIGAFSFTVLVLIPIIVIINLTDRIDDLIQHGVGVIETVLYYIDFSAYLMTYLMPIIVFISVVFVTARLASNTEIVAMLSSGMSYQRVMRPYFYGAIVLAIFNFVLVGWITPNSNKDRIDFEKAYFRGPDYNNDRNIHIQIKPNVYFYLESYRVQSQTGYKFTLEEFNDDGGMVSKLYSNKLTWTEDSLGNEFWRTDEYVIRKILDGEEQIEAGEYIDTTFALTPKDFESDKNRNETFTIPQLREFIALLELRGSDDKNIYLIELYVRYMSPFTVILLTFIGVIVSSRKTRGGSSFQIALGFLLAFIYIILFIMSRSFAQNNGDHLLIPMWTPNFIFTAIGVYLYIKAPK
ncbi:LptF/LptG family permease [Marinigracilibium pacificum]|uniref:YjgP/YjgQ family permease n=1 Tax=Marinigracilibium pacificum TaxID=2729599 RepID=A0A848J7Q1_9BACT|nr:LptF/LptG family permease [Marinigracilibium pacificum]NMM49132.1 YjgP/YjgQ family permease [Marinigracilibium pacificum]